MLFQIIFLSVFIQKVQILSCLSPVDDKHK